MKLCVVVGGGSVIDIFTLKYGCLQHSWCFLSSQVELGMRVGQRMGGTDLVLPKEA